MSPRNATRGDSAETSAPEVSSPPLVFEYTPETFKNRARYAANDAIKGRRGQPGIIAALRDRFSSAGDKSVVLTITTK